MIRKGYEKPRCFTISNVNTNIGGWQSKNREYAAVTPPRPRKTLRRSSSFSNDVDIPPLVRQDRALIPAVPRFEQAMKSLDVREGAPACLTCKVYGNPFPGISWLRNRKALLLRGGRIKDNVDEDGRCSLNFLSAKAEDRGSYTCVATNQLGKVNCSALLNVHVGGGFSKPGFSSVKAPVTNAVRRETKIQKGVASHQAPGSGQNSCGESIKSSDSGISRPSSRDTSSTDSYPVFSDNITSSSQAHLRRSKEASMGDRAPQFPRTPRSQVVEESHSVLFQCKVDGSPKPALSWYKGNSKLKDSERIVLSENISGDCSLEILDLTATDAGSYRCVAMNRAGKSSVSVELMLAAKAGSHSSKECPPSFSQPLTDVDVNEGSRARFECKVEARPKPTVEWMKDGELITASSRVRIMEVYGTHSLVLSRTDHGDTGTYTINASNHVGSESCSAQLRVKEPSYSSRGSTPKGLRSGYGSSEVVTPTYSSSGSPATSAMSSPSMSPKLGRAINSRLVSGSVSSPWSTDLKSRSGGVGGGSSQRRRAPGFILRPRPQTIAPGEKLVLKCTLLGHPKPNVTWDRDGYKLDESDDRVRLRDDGSDYFLEVDDCSSSDSGKYTVSAKNSLGKQSATVDITVSGTGASTAGKNRTTSSISVSRTNHHDISDSLNNNSKPSVPRNVKSQRIEVTINSKNVNTSNNENSESERKHVRDYILPPHSHKEDVKPSSTSSYSSYTSSRMSTSSSRSASSSNDESPSHRSKRSKQVAPTFTRRLSSTQVLEGEDLELNCEITGSPTPEMTWTRNGVSVTPRNSSNSIEFKDGVARLRVSRIQSSQAGEYVCQAKNELGITKCSSRVTVKPKPKQLKPKFTRHPRDIRISEGETLTLEAEVSGQPTPEVLWSVDGQEISNGECTYRNNIAKLILHDVTLACSGQYMCTAINDAGEDYAACRVRIKQKKLDIPPEFTAPLSDVKSKEGEDVCLRCMVTGIPEPRVQWLFNDEVLDSGDGIEITYHDGVAALTLDMATTEDTGCFSCVAVNTEGKSTTSCQVVVSETPRQAPVVEVAPEFITRFEDYIRTMEGDCITLACKVKATPDPEITWKINGKLVRDAKISFENGQASMVLDPVTSDHAGNVICMAKNSCGQTKHEGRLYVRAKREAPSFVTQLAEGVEVQEGKEVTFGCQIKGHPQPRVSWTRNGRSLSVLNTETSYEEGKSSVRIRKAGTSDAGRYVCTARNLSGEAESSCMVTVVQKEATQKPAFTKRLADINLDEGQDIRLVCDVTGLPIPAISWILDGQKLEAEDGEATFKNGVATMLMEDAMTEDSGIYECVARNSEGEARTRCNVKVTAKKAAKAVEEGPSFPIQLEDMTINENEDIVLKCLVKGNPKPTITWLLDGAPFTDAECKYSEDGHAELFLPEALPEDDGVYTCIAQNQLNRVMCSCKVTVKAIPKVKRKQISNKEAEPARLESKTTVQTSRSAWSSKKSTVEPGEVKSPRTTPTSSSVNINGKAEQIRKYPRPASSEDEEQKEQKRDGPDRPPKFIEDLQDRVVPDGSINYKLVARVSGIPPPSVKWYVNDEEIEDTDDFRYETNGDKRILIFAEIFPEDSGPYTCVAMNSVGEVRSKMKMTVEEIDGDPPNFITKPRPLTVNAGENAVFTCKVDGEPEPTLQWLYCNQPIAETERVTIIPANAQNNYVHSLEVCEATIEDAGRYAACCKNLLGDITCTVSLIVNAPKNQEEKKDFRNVLKHSASTKSKHGDQSQAEQVDFRGVLKRQVETNSTTESNQAKAEDAPDFREALSRPVRTKVLTEEERKLQRAEQKDFRGKLVRKVDTKTVTNEALKVKSPSQKDFRDEALKTKVKTKAYAEEVIKQKHAEQVDFRAEALKTKVTPKAYREENIKAMRAEQVDFREVLSPTAKRLPSKEEMSPTSETPKFELSGTPAKMKLNKDKMEHNTVATRRARARGGVAEPVRRTKASEEEVPKGKAPEFNKEIEDKKVNDASPFELVCHVTGHPPPKVSWFLGDEEIHSEADISITQEGGVCKLAVTESFPDDEGTYLCRAENEHGVAQCSAHVTVVTDEPPEPIDERPKFVKKQTSLPESLSPARIEEGPDDLTILRGNPISLCCKLSGSPPLKTAWRKGKHEISHSSQCNIDITNHSASLTIVKSEKDDSGCYTLQVKNAAGVDQYSVNVSVVDVPDPPGQPFASDISASSLVLSWYGSGYDGGSLIKSYQMEMAEIDTKGKLTSQWSVIASTNSTSYTLKNLKPNTRRVFRISAENRYGVSKPGPQSDVVINTETEVVESSDEEDAENFVKHDAVLMRTDGSFSEKYEIKEKLGQGRFGKVHRVISRNTGKSYAAKIMRALKAKDKEAVQQEIDVMNSLRHPRLVQLIDAYTHGREITMVMDLVAGGELFERVIDEDFELTEAACIKYMRQICDGLKYMHDNMILHLDLKPENIMCINKTGTKIKIIDFGLARRYSHSETIRVMFGTPEFVAPEVINYDAIGPQTDMWSVGVICYILLSGLSPFMGDNDSETLSNITAVEWDFDDDSFDQISDEAKHFIRQLLVKPLGKRYTVSRALEHRWLKKDTEKMSKSKLNTKNLKRFLARRKWQKTGNAVRALGRLASLANLGSSNSNKTPNGQQRESGFLAALKAQLLRDNEEEQLMQENCKPMFEQLFDDIEVIEGSAAKFECVIIGTPDPEIMWFKDGEPIKESRHYKISYTEDDICSLLITDATEADEAEYSCKAVNCEGEVEHRAELIVITPDKISSSDSLYDSSISRSSSFSSDSSFSSTKLIKTPSSSVSFWAFSGQAVAFIFESFHSEKDTPVSQSENASVFQWIRCESKNQDLGKETLVLNSGNRLLIQNDMEGDNPTALENLEVEESSTYTGGYKATSVMILQNVMDSDAGYYLCQEKRGSNQLSIEFHLHIANETFIHKKTKSLSPRFVKCCAEQSVPELVNAELQCTVLGNPTPIIEWYQHGTRIFISDRYKFSDEGSNATLTIIGTHWYDSGKYECRAINTVGEASCFIELYVEPPEQQSVEFDGSPMFLSRIKPVDARIGKLVSFTCMVAGVPTPKIHWKMDGYPLTVQNHPRCRITSGQGGRHELTIRHVLASDKGKYVCVAENEKGTAYCSSFLRIKGEKLSLPTLHSPMDMSLLSSQSTYNDTYSCLPSPNADDKTEAPMFVTQPHRSIVRSGGVAVFRCTVHGTPNPKVYWFHNGIKMKNDSRYRIDDIFGHHCLHIRTTRLSDQGTYICTASNPFGEVSCSAQLEVKMRERSIPPCIQFKSNANQSEETPTTACLSSLTPLSIDKPPKKVWVHSGKTVKLSLTVKGTPKPEVTWNKQGKRIQNGNRYTVSSNGETYMLKISRVNKTDEGYYSVVAYNSAGLTITNLIIHVKEKPVVPVFKQVPSASVTVHKNADATLRCVLKDEVIDSHAKWLKNETLISDEESKKYEMREDGLVRELTIKNVASTDSGSYVCKVKEQTASAELRVVGDSENVEKDESNLNEDGNRKSRELTEDSMAAGATEMMRKTPTGKNTLCDKNLADDEIEKIVTNPSLTQAKITTTSLPTHMKVPEHGSVVIQHSVDQPNVACTWKLNGVQLENERDCKIMAQGCKHTLELLAADPSIAGEVLFQINGQDDVRKTILEIEALPPPPHSATATRVETDKVKIAWQASPVETCDITSYIIEKLDDYSETWSKVAEVTSHVDSFTVGKLLAEKVYSFRVRSKNNAGMSTACAKAEKLLGPQLAVVHGLEDKKISEGEVAHFTVQLNQANVSGDWYLNGLKLISRGESCQIHATANAYSLLLRNLSATGSAKVEFTTSDGKISSSCNLVVEGNPVYVVKELEDATVIQNSDVTFTVALSRDVGRTGKWYHKGTLLKQSLDIVIGKHAEYHTLMMKNVKGTASGLVQFELPCEPKAKSKAELFVKGWYELEPFQKIVETPTETITLKEGGDAEITVHISNNSKCKPEWLHNGKPVQLKSKRYAVKQKDNVIKLIIKNMTPSDAGKVECIVDKDRCVTQVVVENLNEATITERDLVKENHSIFADVEANDRLVKRNFTEGETNIELDCKVVDSSSEVLWKFNGKTLSEDDESFKIASKNSRCVLQIGCLKSSHNGIFECKSKCNPSDSIKFQVKVKEKLQLFTAKLPSTSKLTEGDDIMLSVKCDQTGSDARWFKDGIMLTIEKNATGSKDSPIPHIELRHSEDSLNHMLIIHNATMADAGKYSCETLHDVTSCKVLIDEPVVTIQEGLKDVEIEEKETASFQVKLSGKVKNKICWKLNNKILTSSNRCQITSSDNAFSITLRMLSLCDSGIICFQCGDLSQTAKLAVKVPPAVFSKQLSKITTVTEGHEAIFTCEISSENAGVEWRKGDIVLAPSAKYLFVSEGRSRSLSIKNVHCTDSGVYECHTDVDCVQSQLVVQEPKLEILEDLEDADVTEGENASFTLKLSKPNVRVEWLKDGEVLENIEKRRQIASEGFWHALHWRKLELDDSGLISVKVNGETVAEAVLDVKKPPVIFTKELRDLVVDLKTPTEFICEVSNEDSAVTWYRDNVEIDFRSDDIAVLNLQVLSKGTVRKLVIERTYVHHEGKYMCVTESNDRTAGELFVKVPKVEIIRNLDDVKAFKGDDVEFQTEVSCAEVDGEWMIDSEHIYMTDKIDIVREHELRILRIRDVNDSIVVSFQAAKNVVTSCRLDVADRPITIVRRLSDMAVRPGGTVVLECEFSKSNLDVTWLYDGKELTTSDKISVSNDGTLHRLELHNVRYDDEGNYTCRYRNRRTSAEIQVHEPRVHVIEPLSDLTVMEDETVILECTLSYPEADVTWLKDNCKILASDSVTVEKGEHFSKHTYVISNSETNDSGNYMISFREKILCSAQVTVRSLPVVVDVPLQDIKVQDDVEYVLLRCKFSRAVRVIWKKDNDIIEDSDKYQIQSFGVEHELTISSISKLDTSFYTCLPVTLCCETTCYVNVEEYLVSVLEPLPENIIFATGTSGVCFCKISLHVNACEVQWLIDDLAISEILEEKYGRITTEIKKNEHILSFSFVTKDLHDKLITFKCRNLSFSGKLEVVSAPSHPRNLTVTPGEDKDVVLTWIASQEDGGRAVELYEVFQCSDDDGGVWQKKTRIHTSWSDDTMIYKARLIDLEHDVKYKFSVTAVNCVGSSVPTESSSEFFIQSPLVFINPLADVTVIRGECIELFCQLSRASHDQTMWVHDGITLEENENIMLLEDDVIREMIIEDANLEDTGTYSCTIDGITTKCNVQVKEPLHFETVLSDITSETGTDVAFSCWVSDSFAQCKWMKDGTDIESKQNARFVLQENMHQRSLTIAGCIAEDSGLYECVVCNDREEITTQASLQIHQSEDDSIEDLQECSIESIISQTNSIEEPKYIQTNFSECEIEVVTVTIHSEMCMNKETTDKDITEEVLSENDSNQNLQSMSLEGKSCGEKDNQLLEIKNSIETNIEKTTELEIPASAQPCSTTQTNIESVQDEGLDLVTDHALSTATVEKSSEISQGTVALAAISSEVIQIRDLDTVEEKNVHDEVSDDDRAEAEEEAANGVTEGDNSMITEGTGEQTLADITSAEDQVYTPETVVKLMGEMSSDYLKSKEENEFAKSCNISLSKSMDKRISIVSSMTSLEGYDTAVESLQTDEENYQSAVSDVNTICESQTSSSSETEDYHVKVEEMIRPQHLALDFSNTGDDLELATPTPSTTCLTILNHLACQNLQNEVKPTKNQGNTEIDLVTQFAVIPADSVVQDYAEDQVPQQYIGTEDEATVRVVYNMPEKSAANVIDMESVSTEHVTESPEMYKEEGNAASTVVTDGIKEMQENSNLNQIATDIESDVTVSSCVTDSNSHLLCDCPKKATEFPSLENSDGLFPSGQEEMKQKAQAQEIPLAITPIANRGSGFEIVVEEKALSEKDKTTIVIDMKTGIATPVSSAKSSSQDLSERRLSSVLRPEIKIMVEPEVQEPAKLQAEDLHQADVISNHNEEVIQMSSVNFADIHLPDETAEDKLARLFGLDATTCEYQHDVFQEESILIEENKEENAFYRKDNVQLLNVESAKSNLVLFSMDNKSLPGNLKVSSATKEEMNEKTKGYCSDGVTMLHVGSSKEFHVWREENYENPPLAMKNLQENANCSDSDWDEGCSTPCEVIQETMPDFSLELHDQTAAQGQTVEFCCQVAGIPTPSISWQKEQQGGMYLLSNDMPGVEIRYNDNFRGISVLKIHRVKFEDEGRYSCVAINELGHSSCSAYLKVAEVQQELENEGVKCFTSNEEAKERDVIVVKSAQPRPKPLTIRIKERVIVRESSYTDSGSRSDTSSDATGSSSDGKAEQQKGKIKIRHCRLRQSSPDYLATSSDSFNSDGDDKEWNDTKKFNKPQVYVAVNECDSNENESSSDEKIKLLKNQTVEVLEFESPAEWLVQTKASKTSPSRKGFVDPAFLVPQSSSTVLSVISDTAVKRKRSSVTSMKSSSGQELSRMPSLSKSSDREDAMSESLFTVSSWPDVKSEMSASINTSLMLLAGIPEAPDRVEESSTEWQIVQSLINDEEEYISILRRANHILCNSSDLPPAVEERMQEIFGDLDELYNFHVNILLPELNACFSMPSDLPSVFINLSHHFERLHLAHIVNTHRSQIIINEDSDLLDGVHELTFRVGFEMAEVAQKPTKQLNQYQLHLKKLLRSCHPTAVDSKKIRKAIHVLADIPHQARLTRMWWEVADRPLDTTDFGKLSKEGIFQLLDSSLVPSVRKCKMRHLFLFDNSLVVCKLSRKRGCRKNVHSKYSRIFELHDILLVDSPTFADDRTFTLKSTGETQWHAHLRAHTGDSKRSWCRALGRAIEISNGKISVAPSFVEELQDTTFSAGNDFCLECKVSGSPQPSLLWIKDGVEIATHGDRMQITRRDDDYVGLRIRQSTLNDAGTYRCVAVNTAGQACSEARIVILGTVSFRDLALY